MKNLIFIEDNSPTYKSRTIKNAKADATIAFAINFNTLGEKLTRLAVINNDKTYIPITVHYLQIVDERVQATINKLNKVNAKTLNIAGNGLHTLSKFYTQPEIDIFTYKFLKAVLTSSNLKTKITHICSGGQTGFDEAGIKAALKLNIPTTILAPKGWMFRDENGNDICDEKLFKKRFAN